MPGFIAAFSGTEAAAKYMVSQGETGWENAGLVPEPDHKPGGTMVSFDQPEVT